MNFTMCFEMIGTVIFSLQGSLVAIEYGLDVLGIFVLALSTAVGGGMTRDIILGNTPPNLFKDPIYCLLAALTALVVMLTYHLVTKNMNDKIKPFMIGCGNVCDAIGLGIFTVVGMKVCMQAGYQDNLFLCTFVGVLTGVGGGVLRDVLVRRTPVILRKEIYAVAAIIGGICYWYLQQHIQDTVAMYIAAFIIIIIRLLSIKKDVHLPRLKEME